jgi:hypothetical protein
MMITRHARVADEMELRGKPLLLLLLSHAKGPSFNFIRFIVVVKELREPSELAINSRGRVGHRVRIPP